MDDDLNTADAVSVIFELVRAINIAVEKTPTKALAQACLEMLHEFTQVLGLLYQKKRGGEPGCKGGSHDPGPPGGPERKKLCRGGPHPG